MLTQSIRNWVLFCVLNSAAAGFSMKVHANGAESWTEALRSYSQEDANDPDLWSLGSGSGSGRIISLEKGNTEYFIGVLTRNRSALKECPSLDGEVVPCIVKFEHKGDTITKIISARKPSFVGMEIKLPGSLLQYANRQGHLSYANMCSSPLGVDDYPPAQRSFCLSGQESIYINKLNTTTWIVEIVAEGRTYYVDIHDVLVNCRGTSESLEGYVSNHLPPEDGSRAADGQECR